MSISKLNEKQLTTLKFIKNQLMHRGKAPSVREIMRFLGYDSPHTAMIMVNKLIEAGYLKRDVATKELKIINDPEQSKFNTKTVNVPLVGCAPCGTPFLAEENIEMSIPITIDLAKPPHKYFLLRAIGDSMNLKGINSGDLVLVRQQPTADNGDTVVALINNEATIKEFQPASNAIVLKPVSSNKEHKPIIVTDDFQIQGKVIKSLSAINI